MYKVVNDTNSLDHKQIVTIFNNILINTGNKALNWQNYNIQKPINFINFIKVKNLLPLVTFADGDVNIKKCCLDLTTTELLIKLNTYFLAYDPGKPGSDNWHCTSLYCTEPKNLYVSYITGDSAVVGWDMVLGESYDIYLDGFLLYTNVNSPVTITGLIAGTTYTITVVSGTPDSCRASIEFSTTDIEPNLIFSWDKDASQTVSLVGRINGTFDRVDWGDGIIDNLLTHTYDFSGNYTVKFYNTTTTILLIGNKIGASVNRVTAVAKWPSTLVTIDLGSNFLTSIPSLTPLTALDKLLLFKNQIVGTLNISANTLLRTMIIADNLFSGTLAIATNTILNWCEADRNNFTGATGVGSCPLLLLYQISDNKIGVANINTALIALDTAALTLGRCLVNLQTPAAPPSGGGATAVTNLLGKSWTVLTD